MDPEGGVRSAVAAEIARRNCRMAVRPQVRIARPRLRLRQPALPTAAIQPPSSIATVRRVRPETRERLRAARCSRRAECRGLRREVSAAPAWVEAAAEGAKSERSFLAGEKNPLQQRCNGFFFELETGTQTEADPGRLGRGPEFPGHRCHITLNALHAKPGFPTFDGGGPCTYVSFIAMLQSFTRIAIAFICVSGCANLLKK
jgi:hypothetical protein